tara:strand:+ start:667 stop:795 length:129 start_codon:yes stop_codon:yes gene_type:complete
LISKKLGILITIPIEMILKDMIKMAAEIILEKIESFVCALSL